MKFETRNPGTSGVKFWGSLGIEIPVYEFDELEMLEPEFVQGRFERGLFIHFNDKCRQLRKTIGAEKMRAEVEALVDDPEKFYAWLQESKPRGASKKVVDLSGLPEHATNEQVAEYLAQCGIEVINS